MDTLITAKSVVVLAALMELVVGIGIVVTRISFWKVGPPPSSDWIMHCLIKMGFGALLIPVAWCTLGLFFEGRWVVFQKLRLLTFIAGMLLLAVAVWFTLHAVVSLDDIM